MPIPNTDYVTLTAMISPALFMTASGSLIISTSNRMSRIVDRIRVLNDLGDAICRGSTNLDFPAERESHIGHQLHHLEGRAGLIRRALVMLYMAFGSFVGTSLAIGVDVLLSHSIVAAPTALAIVGVLLLFSASMQLVLEALAALRGNRLEVQFYRKLRERRLAASPIPSAPGAPHSK